MKPTIYYLEDKSGKGQPKVIRGLINHMIDKSNEFNFIIRPLDIKNDMVYIIEYENLTIGLMSHEDESHSASDLLHFLNEEKCKAIICTSVHSVDLTKIIARQVCLGNYQSVFLKSIWSPLISVDQLLNYEITKLGEIISLYVDNIPEKFTKEDQDIHFIQNMKAV